MLSSGILVDVGLLCWSLVSVPDLQTGNQPLQGGDHARCTVDPPELSQTLLIEGRGEDPHKATCHS